MREKSGVVRALAARLSAGPATPELTRYETFCRSDELPQDFSSTRRETNPHPDSTSGVSDVEVDDRQTNEDSPMDLSMKSSTTSPHSTTPSSPLSTGLPRERGVKRARLESMVNQLQTKRIERQPIEISPVHSDYPKTTLHLEDSWDEQQSSETLSSSVSPGLSSLEDSFRPRTFSDGALLGQYMHRRHKALQERASKVRLPTLPHPDFNAPMLEVNAPLRHQVRKTPVPQSVPDAPPALLESLLTRPSTTSAENFEDRLRREFLLQQVLSGQSTSGEQPSSVPFGQGIIPSEAGANPWLYYAYYAQALQSAWQAQSKLNESFPPGPAALPVTPNTAAVSPVSASPPSISTTPSPEQLQSSSYLCPPPKRRAPRAMTGKHVRHGTGARPETLLTLRNKITERLSQRNCRVDFLMNRGKKRGGRML